jgi:hypothetical protein
MMRRIYCSWNMVFLLIGVIVVIFVCLLQGLNMCVVNVQAVFVMLLWVYICEMNITIFLPISVTDVTCGSVEKLGAHRGNLQKIPLQN